MANAIYPKAKEKMLAPGTLGTSSGNAIDWVDDTIKVALVDTGTYTYNSSHEYYSSVVSGVVGTPQTIGATKTATNGQADGANVTFSSVSGNESEALVIYKDTGSNNTSPLICYLDTGVTGLPVTPNSGDIDVTWDSSYIFSI